jgi:hypothetical protein
MSQQIEMRQLPEQAVSLSDAATLLGWSRRTLIRALVRHGISTVGSGDGARLEAADLAILMAKEGAITGIATRAQNLARQTEAVPSGETSTESSLRRHWRRRLDQLTRKKAR